MNERQPLKGILIGSPFMATIDTNGDRCDRQNCAFVVSGYQVATGYNAYILDSSFPAEYAKNLSAYCPDASVLYQLSGTAGLCSGDVIEVNADGNVSFAFCRASGDHVLFITNRCNSNCIMCPDSDSNRRKDLGDRKNYLLRLIELLPSDVGHITITGGEPTLLKWDLIQILRQCRDCLPYTDFLMLSNGRTLCVTEYRNAFLQAVPEHFRLAVPLYGVSDQEHDAITRSPGSFMQTLSALKVLQHHIEIEIRIVIMRQNYTKLPEMAAFFARELPAVRTVSLMGMELLGNAANHRDELWISYEETTESIERAVSILLSSGIDVRIYNYPLCALPRNLWSIAAKSISDYKVRYQESCADCLVKELCGGFFYSTLHFEDIPIHPVRKEIDA